MTEEAKVKLAATVIKRAMDNGLLEVQVYRFPNTMCTDHGRAINQAEAGWEKTLTGIPGRSITFGTTISGKKVQDPLSDPRISGWPARDIGITLSWH